MELTDNEYAEALDIIGESYNIDSWFDKYLDFQKEVDMELTDNELKVIKWFDNGCTRLYRASAYGKEGKWFTDSLAQAQEDLRYITGGNVSAHLDYIDVKWSLCIPCYRGDGDYIMELTDQELKENKMKVETMDSIPQEVITKLMESTDQPKYLHIDDYAPAWLHDPLFVDDINIKYEIDLQSTDASGSGQTEKVNWVDYLDYLEKCEATWKAKRLKSKETWGDAAFNRIRARVVERHTEYRIKLTGKEDFELDRYRSIERFNYYFCKQGEQNETQ